MGESNLLLKICNQSVNHLLHNPKIYSIIYLYNILYYIRILIIRKFWLYFY